MSEKRIGIIMHGVTGRMGMNQHLIRSILEIRRQGGVVIWDNASLLHSATLIDPEDPRTLWRITIKEERRP